jgi:uncharacterized repeat protein (TIGR01451 family)
MTYARAAATVALIAALPVLAATAALAKPVVVITLAQATVVSAADGTSHLAPLDGSTPIASGVVIRYTISAKDTGTDAARGLELSGHVPSGTTFVVGSIHGPAGHAEFSLDGKSFSAQPMVAVKNPAGDVVMQPADPALYVMIRWTKNGPLVAQTSTAFTYDVKVK